MQQAITKIVLLASMRTHTVIMLIFGNGVFKKNSL